MASSHVHSFLKTVISIYFSSSTLQDWVSRDLILIQPNTRTSFRPWKGILTSCFSSLILRQYLLWTTLCLSPIHIYRSPNSQYSWFADKNSKEVIMVKWGHKGVALIR
jgi:hypothetical protein